MPRACFVCNIPDQAVVKAAFAGGGSDRALAQQFGVSHMAIGRHRRTHLVAPMQAAAAALDKGRATRQRQQTQLAAIKQGDPLEILSMGSIARDLATVHDRLDTSAGVAATANQHTAHAALAGQILRGVELRGKLGGHDKTPVAGGAAAAFSVVFQFAGAPPERFTTAGAVIAEAQPHTTIDMKADDEDEQDAPAMAAPEPLNPFSKMFRVPS